MKEEPVLPWPIFNFGLKTVKQAKAFKDKVTPPQLRLMEMLNGFALTQIVRTAAELKIPDALAEDPKDVIGLAQELDVNPQALSRFMVALTAIGLTKSLPDEKYALSPVGELLKAEVPGSFYSMAISFGREWYGGIWELSESIKTGKSSFKTTYGEEFFSYLDHHPESQTFFNQSMVEATSLAISAILKEYDFSTAHHLVDIGGGMGHFLKRVLEQYPAMTGTVYDQPSVIEKAKLQSDSRISFIAGNFFESIPKGGDTYLLQRVLHDWDDELVLTILKNCYDAMSSDGRLLVLEPGPVPDKVTMAVQDLLMLTLLGGQERNDDHISTLLQDAGCKVNRIIKTRSPIRIFEAVKA